jgi:actin-related protein 8
LLTTGGGGTIAGLERTDNGMKQTTWPEVVAINQKNYYT